MNLHVSILVIFLLFPRFSRTYINTDAKGRSIQGFTILSMQVTRIVLSITDKCLTHMHTHTKMQVPTSQNDHKLSTLCTEVNNYTKWRGMWNLGGDGGREHRRVQLFEQHFELSLNTVRISKAKIHVNAFQNTSVKLFFQYFSAANDANPKFPRQCTEHWRISLTFWQPCNFI